MGILHTSESKGGKEADRSVCTEEQNIRNPMHYLLLERKPSFPSLIILVIIFRAAVDVSM